MSQEAQLIAMREALDASWYAPRGYTCGMKKALVRLLKWSPELKQFYSKKELLKRLKETRAIMQQHHHNHRSIERITPQELEYHHILPPMWTHQECAAIDQLSDLNYSPKFWVLIVPDKNKPHSLQVYRQWRSRCRKPRRAPAEQESESFWICTKSYGWFQVFYSEKEVLADALETDLWPKLKQHVQKGSRISSVLIDSNVDPRLVQIINENSFRHNQDAVVSLPRFYQHALRFRLPLQCYVESAVAQVKRHLIKLGTLTKVQRTQNGKLLRIPDEFSLED